MFLSLASIEFSRKVYYHLIIPHIAGEAAMTYYELIKVLEEHINETRFDSAQKLLAAANANDPDALFDICVILQIYHSLEESLPYLEKAAELGNVPAMFQLSVFCYHGEIDRYKNSYDKAFPLLKKCADAGDIIAKYNVGMHYLYDSDKRDIQVAVKYLREAGDADDSVCDRVAAEFEALGDYAEAIKYYKKAKVVYPDGAYLFPVDEENIMAEFYPSIAYCYYLAEDYVNAIKYINKGIIDDNPYCYYLLGRMYYEGKGFDEDAELAIKYLKKSASYESGWSVDACVLLGDIFSDETHKGIIDKSKALFYFEKAQKLGRDCKYAIEILKEETAPLSESDALLTSAEDISAGSNALGNYLRLVKNDLKQEFGQCWDKLSDFTQRVLITGMVSLVTYVACEKEYPDIHMDYSTVILSLSRALEREIKDIFYVKFKQYLKSENVDPYIFQRLNGFVEQRNDCSALSYTESDAWFTLGKFKLIVNFKNKFDSFIGRSVKTIDPDLLDFCDRFVFKASAFSKDWKKRKEEITAYLGDFAQQVDVISKEYRNESAHTSNTATLHRARICVDWIIKVKHMLYNFVDKIDYAKLSKLKS